MKNKLNAAIVIATTGAILALGALPAFAQVGLNLGANVSASASAGASSNVGDLGITVNGDASARANAVVRANNEIKNRIDALNALEVRINAAQKLSSDEKSTLSSNIQAQISSLTNLGTQIKDDESSTSSLRLDIDSITKGHRIFALVVPQMNIAVTADREMAIVDAFTNLGATLQTRITAAQSEGANMSASLTALADYNAKIADAKVKAQAAVDATATLTPDNGDKAKMQANIAALQSARADIRASQQDLIAARADARVIVKAVKAAEKIEAHSSTTVESTTTNQ